VRSPFSSYDFQGNCEREWILDSVIRYIKVVGGPVGDACRACPYTLPLQLLSLPLQLLLRALISPRGALLNKKHTQTRSGREGLLVGLKNGQILKIFVDNPFPQLLIKHSSCIRCLDLSMSRRQLAVVDDTSTAFVYDLVSNRETYRDSDVSSVAFNSVYAAHVILEFHIAALLFDAPRLCSYEDMLCYSGQNTLSIRTSDFEPHREKLVGFVVGVKGSKVFCLQVRRVTPRLRCSSCALSYILLLQVDSMKTVDVPQSASMHKFLQKGNVVGAAEIATLGVTESDWRLLGDTALKKLEFDVARQAYIRVRDVRTVTFIKRLEAMRKDPRVRPPQVLALFATFCVCPQVLLFFSR
jgi:intraflagellar transport protein 122